MYIKIILKSLLFIVLMTSCATNNLLNYDLPTYQLNIDKSITLEENDVLFYRDFKDNHFLSYDEYDHEILIHNLDGKLIHKISKHGEGPEEYGEILQLGFGKNKTIHLITYSKIMTYDFGGKLLKSIPLNFDENYPLSGSNITEIDSKHLLFHAVDTKISAELPDYFNHTHNLALRNENSKEIKKFAYYETESIYRKKYFPNLYSAFYTYTNEKIYVGYPYEKNIYEYNLEDLSLNKTIPITPIHFGETFSNGKNDAETQLYLIQKNGFYRNINIQSNIITLSYDAPFPDHLITKSIEKLNNNAYLRTTYLELYTLDGTKICQDIALPKGTGLVKVLSKDKVILQRTFAPENENEEEGNIFYLASITNFNE